MELKLQKLSIMLIDSSMTDQQFTEEILFFKQFPVRSIFVLPYNVIRAKQLLTGTMIRVGSFVDFPLGNGTLAKKAFETGQMYREGASDVFVTMAPEQLRTGGNQKYQVLEQLSFGRDALGFYLDSSKMTDRQKNKLASDLAELNIPSFALGLNLTMEQAIYDMNIFRIGHLKNGAFQVNVQAPTLLEIELLFQAGVSQIGINNGREVLPLISKWN